MLFGNCTLLVNTIKLNVTNDSFSWLSLGCTVSLNEMNAGSSSHLSNSDVCLWPPCHHTPRLSGPSSIERCNGNKQRCLMHERCQPHSRVMGKCFLLNAEHVEKKPNLVGCGGERGADLTVHLTQLWMNWHCMSRVCWPSFAFSRSRSVPFSFTSTLSPCPSFFTNLSLSPGGYEPLTFPLFHLFSRLRVIWCSN